MIASNEDLRTLYCAADVVAVPSREDNMPLSAMEAQACGRPVVGFEVGGLPDIVDHFETGYIAEPFDFSDLARGISLALTTPASQDSWGENAGTKANSTWSGPAVAKRYVEVYESALE